MKKNKLLLIGAVLLGIVIVTALVLFTKGELYADSISLEEAQAVIDSAVSEGFTTTNKAMSKMQEVYLCYYIL